MNIQLGLGLSTPKGKLKLATPALGVVAAILSTPKGKLKHYKPPLVHRLQCLSTPNGKLKLLYCSKVFTLSSVFLPLMGN